MFEDALTRAKSLDLQFKKTGTVTGPLHGLPISLKDNFNIPGYPSSVGFTAWALTPSTETSTIVTLLLSLGAIPYVKTNVPTAMMIAESVNNVHGRTLHPQNRSMTSGGSSGGESALIAMRGSPLGVGTDIGGSLRIPAACTGIFTLRPSFGRFPHFDARSGMAGQEAVASVHGPMARSLPDLRLFAENVTNAKPWTRDPKCIPDLHWRRDVPLKQKLKIGVLWHNGLVHPTPPVRRALLETVEKLRATGNYEIIDWPATDHAEAVDLLGKFFLADGGKSIGKILQEGKEPWRPEMRPYEQATELGVYDLWLLQKQRTELCARYLRRWEEVGLDAILGPTTPYATTRNGEFRHVGYTGVFNIVDYTSASFPCGIRVDKGKDGQGEEEERGFFNEVDELTQKEYDVDAAEGLEVSLQLTGKRLEEEKVLGMVERVLGDLR